MDCLKGYIALRIEKDDVSPSGLFINDLDGISLKMLDAIADEENDNFKSVWESIEDNALAEFGLLLRKKIKKNYSLIDPVVTDCIVCYNKKEFAIPLRYFLGVEVMLKRMASERENYFTTVDIDTADMLSKTWYAKFEDLFNAVTDCLDIYGGDCLPVTKKVERNNTYSYQPARF